MMELLKEVNRDKNLVDASQFKPVNRKTIQYSFKVDGNEYRIELTSESLPDNESILSVSFLNVSAIEKLKKQKDVGGSVDSLYGELDNAKFGLTGEGNPFRVFNVVYNAVIEYIEKYSPQYLKFEAVEDNRKKLYDTLISRAQKETELKLDRIDTDPSTGNFVKETGQIRVYRIKTYEQNRTK